MSFVWFRKFHKPFLWFAVIFTVLVFATFSGLSDLEALLTRGDGTNMLGEFKLAGSGAVRKVPVDEFARVRTELNRWSYAMGRQGNLEDADVWALLMSMADARAAGLDVAPEEVGRLIATNLLPPGQSNKEAYRELWNQRMQFASARDFEKFVGNLMLVDRWRQVNEEAAGIVDADEIYLRWRADHELFDIDAVVIPDLALDQIADPAPETLRAWWDELPELQRSRTYVEPVRQDIVYAWLPLNAGPELVSVERLAELPEPDPNEVAARFEQLQQPQQFMAAPTAARWPDKTGLDDEARAELVHELKLVKLAQQAYEAFQAATGKSAAAFAESMAAAGLTVVNPEGELGPDELKALPEIGDEMLPLFLGQRKAGDVHFGYPYAGQDHVSVIYVETLSPSRPLSFEEAHDQVLTAWKEAQRGQPARDFRDALRARTRELPEVAALIAPLLEAAEQRAAEQIAAQPELDEAGKAALREQVVEASEQGEVLPRLAEHEHRVWTEVPLPEGSRRVELAGVSRGYAANPTGEEAADSVERFLKTNGAVFRIAVDSISEPLRHGPSNSTVVVRVAGRSFPDMAAMLADPAGLKAAREQLAAQRQTEVRAGFEPARMALSHELRILEPARD